MASAGELRGKVALVTGSTSGIGLAMARTLAAAGADVMLNGLGDPAAIERQRADLAAETGIRVLYDGADMQDADAIAAMVARTERELGRLDILVNNAGIQHVAPIASFPRARWDAIIAINLSAAFHGMQAAIPGMTGRGWGRIVNIASAHGLVASGSKSAYVAAKHGIIGLTKVGAIELADTGITCNAICPGWVLTPLVQAQLDARAAAEGRPLEAVTREMLREKQPMAQFTTPENLAALLLFLCSNAAQTITGASLPMDGGWTAQ